MHLPEIDDALGAARSYLHAIEMAVTARFKGEGEDYCALTLLVASAIGEICKAHQIIDELPGGEDAG